MHPLEFKDKASQSSHIEWFNSLEIKLKYPHLKFEITLTGITTIYEFIYRNLEEYSLLERKVPPEIQSSRERFERWKKLLIHIVNHNISSNAEWANFSNNIQNINIIDFLFDSPTTIFLINLYNESPKYYEGAYEFITNNNLNGYSNKDRLTGYILAYEFSFSGSTELINRAKLETDSFAALRSKTEEYLSNSELHFTHHLTKLHNKSNDIISNIDKFLSTKKEEYGAWFNNTSAEFSAYHKKCEQSISEMEQLYREKLKLEAPAKYWKDKATSLKKEGGWWLSGLILTIIIALTILIKILFGISDGTIERIFSHPGTAIKWSVVLITIISFLAYAIRTLAKFTFSSFHLFRDAQEREQLTYVYLALQNQKGIDQTERHLIMQSLFSRADSGLLKDDGSPTMPGSLVEKVVSGK